MMQGTYAVILLFGMSFAMAKTWDLELKFNNMNMNSTVFVSELPKQAYNVVNDPSSFGAKAQFVYRKNPRAALGWVLGFSYDQAASSSKPSELIWVSTESSPATLNSIQYTGNYQTLSSGLDLAWLGKYLGIGVQITPGLVWSKFEQIEDQGSCEYADSPGEELRDAFGNLLMDIVSLGNGQSGKYCQFKTQEHRVKTMPGWGYNMGVLYYTRIMPSWPVSIDAVANYTRWGSDAGLRLRWNFL